MIKYVVLNNGGLAGEEIILFPATKTHKDFKVLGNIISAGFVGRSDVHQSGFYVYGESTSLGLKSRGEADQVLLDISFKKDDY